MTNPRFGGVFPAVTTQLRQDESLDLPATARMDLVSLASTGDGGSTVDLGSLIASSANVKLQMLMKMRLKMGEQPPQDIETTMDMSMAVTSR